MSFSSYFKSERSRWIVLSASLLAAGLMGSSCVPLKDLSEYGTGPSEEVAGDGGETGDGGSEFGGSEFGGADSGTGGTKPEPEPVCGDGVVEGGEECDVAGVATTCAADCTVSACALGCKCWMEGRDVINLCSAPVAFSAAAQSCEQMGGYFNLPASSLENYRLARETLAKNYSTIWIGGTDAEKEGTWINGFTDPFWVGDVMGEAVGDAYTNWEPNQPDDYMQQEDCAFLGESGLWNDEDCASANIYSCRIPSPVSATCGDGTIDPGEACDDKGDSSACDFDCTAAVCGDGYTNVEAGEECDMPLAAIGTCSDDCKDLGLVSHFPFIEKRGKKAFDAAKWDRVAELAGTADFVSAGNGLTLLQNGAACVAKKDIPTIAGPITMMGLIRMDDKPAGFLNIMEFYSNTEETIFRFSGSLLQVGSWQDDTLYLTEVNIDSTIDTGVFTHVAGRYDGTNWDVFLDGKLVGSSPHLVGASGANAFWCIGGRDDLARGFNGKILDVRVYDRDLSNPEIRDIADALLEEWL